MSADHFQLASQTLEDSSRRGAKTIIAGGGTATYDDKEVKETPDLLCRRVANGLWRILLTQSLERK